MNALTSFMPLLLCPARETELDGSLKQCGRRNKGHDIWPRAEEGVAVLTPAQLSMLLEGIDWRRPVRTAQPVLAG